VINSGFSEDLTRFIQAEIQSIEQLEILLLLAGEPHRFWSPEAVYAVVKSSQASVSERLKAFADRRILKCEEVPEIRFQFAPETDMLWRNITELVQAHKQRPLKVIEAIYSRPPDAIQEFAKAFDFRKKK
jgi:hypothetical protein